MLPLSDGLPARYLAFYVAGGFVCGWVVARALLDARWIHRQTVERRRSALAPL